VAVFRDSAHAREVLEAFFKYEATVDDPFFGGNGVVIAYTLKDPVIRIVLDTTRKPEPGHRYDVYVDDPNAPKPTVELFMRADTFDALYRGEMAPSALMTGRARAEGDLSASMRLLPAMARAIPRYKKYREEHG
jgi:putative sterol carrier protein